MIDDVAEKYFMSRPYRDHPNPKIAVFFLACSGSGKTSVTEAIVSQFGATSLSNDDARQFIRELDLVISPRLILHKTWDKLRAETPNGFIVFDSSMSNYYNHEDSYYKTAIHLGYSTFIIAIDLSKEELESRVRDRGRYDTNEVLKLLPDQLESQHKAMAVLNPNYVLSKNSNIDSLLANLRDFIDTQIT
jgi:guanylate kinase